MTHSHSILWCDAVSLSASFPAFLKIVVPQFSECSSPRNIVFGLPFPWRWNTTILRNVGHYSPKDTAPEPRWPESSAAPEVSHLLHCAHNLLHGNMNLHCKSPTSHLVCVSMFWSVSGLKNFQLPRYDRFQTCLWCRQLHNRLDDPRPIKLQ